MASFERTKNGNWRAFVTVNYKRKSETFPSRAQALAWAGASEVSMREQSKQRANYFNKFKGELFFTVAQDLFNSRVVIPNFSGIYILFDGDDVSYVGQSRNILGRMADHKKNGRVFTHYVAIPVMEEELTKMEQYYINLLKPAQNRTKVSDIEIEAEYA